MFKNMPFVLFNALSTFQHCMASIFYNMVKDTIEVFMDDIYVIGDEFDTFWLT